MVALAVHLTDLTPTLFARYNLAVKKSSLIIVAGLGAALLAGAGVYYWWLPQDGVRPSVPAVFKRGPAPTALGWPARVDVLVDGGMADPFGVAAHPDGSVFIADGGDSNQLRILAPDGSVSLLAGGAEGYRDGIGPDALFNTPSGVALDREGNLYVADTGNHAIRKVTRDGKVSTLAGSGVAGFADGMGAQAQFNGPVGVAVDRDGVVYVADTYNDRIRRIARDGSVTTLAGGTRPGFADGVGAAALFDTPCGIAVAPDGSVVVADSRNDAIRAIGRDGAVTTLAVAPELEREPLLRRPMALAVTHDGFVYVATGGRGRVVQVAPGGAVGILPDARQPADPASGVDGSVQFYGPRGLALASDGTLLVSDGPAQRLHRISPAAARPPIAPGVLATTQASPAVAPGAVPRRDGLMPWPVLPQDQPHEVVGLMGEVRGSYDGDSRHHFHAGLDVQADVGRSVHVVEAAKVTDPLPNWAFGSVSEGINLGTASYIHMKVGRDRKNRALDPRFELLLDERGKPERVRVRRGTRFAVGDQLGVVNQMAHVHLNLYDRGRVVNPLALPFPGLRDTIAPRIQAIALYDVHDKRLPVKKGQRLRLDRALGEVSVVVDAFDQMDGNLARRRLGLYKLGYQLLQADGQPVAGFEQPRIMQTYDQLPKQREAVKVVYSADSGITVYGSKATRFTYSLHSTLAGGDAVPGRWQLSGLAPGDYTLRVYAADFAGNTALEGRDLPLTIY